MKKITPVYILFLFLVPVAVIYYIFLKLNKKKGYEILEVDNNKRRTEIVETPVVPNGLNSRQLDIVAQIEKTGEGRVSELMKIFKTTDRTLRRDFNKLESMGLVKKSGSTKSASYRLVK